LFRKNNADKVFKGIGKRIFTETMSAYFRQRTRRKLFEEFYKIRLDIFSVRIELRTVYPAAGRALPGMRRRRRKPVLQNSKMQPAAPKAGVLQSVPGISL